MTYYIHHVDVFLLNRDALFWRKCNKTKTATKNTQTQDNLCIKLKCILGTFHRFFKFELMLYINHFEMITSLPPPKRISPFCTATYILHLNLGHSY